MELVQLMYLVLRCLHDRNILTSHVIKIVIISAEED